jgi:hypothetical protein
MPQQCVVFLGLDIPKHNAAHVMHPTKLALSGRHEGCTTTHVVLEARQWGFCPKSASPMTSHEFAPSGMLNAPDKLVQFQKVHDNRIV